LLTKTETKNKTNARAKPSKNLIPARTPIPSPASIPENHFKIAGRENSPLLNGKTLFKKVCIQMQTVRKSVFNFGKKSFNLKALKK
jgi:hypothetical protein